MAAHAKMKRFVQNGVLWVVLFAILDRPAAEPSGPHVCAVEESHAEMESPPCVPPAECPPTAKNRSSTTKTRIVRRCCEGYQEVSDDGATAGGNETFCVPRCRQGCGRGHCIEPDVCECPPGFMGEKCHQRCKTGFWGRNCTNHCDCQNHAFCSSKNGICICMPGWTGEKCEKPCEKSFFGPSCTRKCHCGDYPCNPRNGKCLIEDAKCSGGSGSCTKLHLVNKDETENTKLDNFAYNFAQEPSVNNSNTSNNSMEMILEGQEWSNSSVDFTQAPPEIEYPPNSSPVFALSMIVGLLLVFYVKCPWTLNTFSSKTGRAEDVDDYDGHGIPQSEPVFDFQAEKIKTRMKAMGTLQESPYNTFPRPSTSRKNSIDQVYEEIHLPSQSKHNASDIYATPKRTKKNSVAPCVAHINEAPHCSKAYSSIERAP